MFSTLIKKLESTSGSKDKQAILKSASNFSQGLLKLALDPYVQFYMNKIPKLEKTGNESLENHELRFVALLAQLSNRNITGNAAKAEVKAFLETLDEANQNAAIRVITKNLNCGVASTSVNKVFPNLVPEFNVARAEIYLEQKEIVFPKIIQAKLDGVRCVAVKENGVVTLLGRSGKELDNFPQIAAEVTKMPIDNVAFDGEIMDKNFQKLMTQLNRKEEVNTEGAYYAIFDLIDLKDFKNGKGLVPYAQRYAKLRNLVKIAHQADFLCETELKGIFLVETSIAENDEKVQEIFQNAILQKFEGVMIKDPNAGYKSKKNKTTLKLKPFKEDTFTIIGYEEGDDKNVGKLGSFIVEHKDQNIVSNVGSGFTDAERQEYWDNREQLIGRKIDVQFQEVSEAIDSETFSLKFPSFLRFRNDLD